MKLKFYKMTGLGNDYVYLDMTQETFPLNFADFAKQVSNRNFSVGSDGLVVLTPSKNADVKMRIFNSDGSEAEICGNALRCVSKLLYDKNGTTNLSVETKKKIVRIKLLSNEENTAIVRVEMGKLETVGTGKITIDEKSFELNLVDAGNPHCVIFVKNFDFDVKYFGEKISKNPIFKEGTNVEFVKILDESHLQVKVYERGSGITLACGSGACASAFCYNRLHNPKNKDISIVLDGGQMEISCKEPDNTIMIGSAQMVFSGKLYLPDKDSSHTKQN